MDEFRASRTTNGKGRHDAGPFKHSELPAPGGDGLRFQHALAKHRNCALGERPVFRAVVEGEDEIAAATGQDPLALRRKLLAKHPRHLGVLNLAAEKAPMKAVAAFMQKDPQVLMAHPGVGVNSIAVLCAVLRMVYVDQSYWPTDIFVAMAASVLSWRQAKRFSELAASYALAAHEIGLIKEQSLLPDTPEKFSLFVGDAENAFSREHTQWVARKDV